MKSILILTAIVTTSMMLTTGCASCCGKGSCHKPAATAAAGCDGSCCKDAAACTKCCGDATGCAKCCKKN